MYARGQGVPQDDTKAVKWFRKAAEQGHAGAQFNLGKSYALGQGAPQDDTKAVRWYRQAAEQGHVSGQNSLGIMYAKGLGVTQDYVAAHKWFNLSAALGHQKASENRDKVAAMMTPAQIGEAQRLAKEWMKKHQK